MLLTKRLESLRKKHHELDDKIRGEQAHPSTDSTVIRSLKRDKLHIKEQIEHLLDAGNSVIAPRMTAKV